MATVRTYQQSFNGGELSPEMFGRASDPKFQAGLAKCKNFLIEPRGPAVNRPGFEYVNFAKYADKQTRLIPFTFSTDQSMLLEFGDKYIRFHTEGQTLMGSNGQPYEVETPYAAEDLFDIHYVQSADILTLVHPSYDPRELRRHGATDWRLTVISFKSQLTPPTNVQAVQTIASSVSNKTAFTREYAVTSLLADGTQESARSESVSVECNPYGDGAYNTISWAAVDGAGLYRVYRNQGGLWAYIGQTDGTSIRDENIDPDASITPPIYDDPFNQAKGIQSVTVTNGGSGYGLTGKIIAVSQTGSLYQRYVYGQGDIYDKTVQATMPCAMVWRGDDKTCRIDAASGSGAVIKSEFNDYVSGNYNYQLLGLRIDDGGDGYPVSGTKVVYENFSSRGYGDRFTVDATVLSTPPTVYVTDPTGSGAELKATTNTEGQVVSIIVVKPGAGYTDPTVVIEDSKGGTGATATAKVGEIGDFPGSVTYFEQRRWFGGTYNRPNNLWATKSGTESDMSYSLPTQDSDRIAVRVAAREANRIEHLVPLSQLMLLTGGAEWRVSPLNSDAITPESMSVRPQSYVGANNVQPVVVNNTMIYAASRGGHLRECGYSYEAGGYVTNDVCMRANHLFDNLTVRDLAYSKAPWPIVWAVSSSGKLLAFTYVPEQQVGAFSTVETNGTIESCAVVPEGDEDILYAVVLRDIAGTQKRFVERMHERQYTSLQNAMHLDCAGTYRGEAKAEISGLSWLEGMTVSILADGSVENDQVVTGGKVTLEQPASVVHVGLPYTSDLQTLPIALALQDGSYGSTHQKNVRRVTVRAVNSSGLSAGPSFEKLTEYPPRSTEYAGSPPDPVTGELGVQITPRWSDSGQVCIRQKYPLPLKIVSLTTTVEIV